MSRKASLLFFIMLCWAFKNLPAQTACNISFTDSASQSCATPGRVSFSTSVVSSHGAVSFTWNFGDTSALSHQPDPQHLYSFFGTYHYYVIGTDTSGCSDTIYNTIVVDTLPVAGFGVSSSSSPCPPFPVQFSNTSTGATKYQWYFGDGGSDSAANPLYAYFYPGTDTVVLIAYNSIGCADTAYSDSIIRINGPIGHFTVDIDSGVAPLTIHFTSIFYNVSNMQGNCGDSITFNNPGTYYPICTLTDSLGCSVSYPIDTIVVEPGLGGISPVVAQSIHIYPNPATDKLIVTLDNPASLMVSNILGQTVLQKKLETSGSIDISTLSPGVYFIYEHQHTEVARFIKE